MALYQIIVSLTARYVAEEFFCNQTGRERNFEGAYSILSYL